jgi:RND family efflux transporter MFP subunit
MMTGLNIVKVLAAAAVAAAVAGAVYLLFPHPGAARSSAATPAAVSHPSVGVVYPRRATLARRLQINATLEAFEEADLFAQISGYLSEVRVDIGDHIKAGQILAVIDVPETVQELAEAEAQLESKRKALDAADRQVEHAKADLVLQQLTFKRQEALNKAKDTSDQSLDNIRARTEIAIADLGVAAANRDLAAAQVDVATATVEKTRALLSYAKIAAPFDGVVAQRQVNRGDLVQAPTASRTTALFKIQRIDTIRVFCDVPENEVALVRAGDPAIVKPFGLNGTPIVGTITRFAHRLDAGTRNMRTEIDLPNPSERLYPGMYAEVSLEMDRRPDALTVPTSAIGSDGNGTFIYTVAEDRIERTPVKIGVRDSGHAELIDGLSEHDAVVANAKRAPAVGTRVQSTVISAKS